MWLFTTPEVHAAVRLLLGSILIDCYIDGWMQPIDCSVVPLLTAVDPRGGVERCELLGPSLVPRWVAPPRSLLTCGWLPRHSSELPKNVFRRSAPQQHRSCGETKRGREPKKLQASYRWAPLAAVNERGSGVTRQCLQHRGDGLGSVSNGRDHPSTSSSRSSRQIHARHDLEVDGELHERDALRRLPLWPLEPSKVVDNGDEQCPAIPPPRWWAQPKESQCVARPCARWVPSPWEVHRRLHTVTTLNDWSSQACHAVVLQQNLRHEPLNSLRQVNPAVSVPIYGVHHNPTQ